MYLSNGPWGSVEAEITPAELLAFYKPHAECSSRWNYYRAEVFGRQDTCCDKRTEDSNYRFRELLYLTVELLYRGITTMES